MEYEKASLIMPFEDLRKVMRIDSSSVASNSHYI